jgi:hypothetical protein
VLEFFDAANNSEGFAAIVFDGGRGHKELHFFLAQGSWAFVSTVYVTSDRPFARLTM